MASLTPMPGGPAFLRAGALSPQGPRPSLCAACSSPGWEAGLFLPRGCWNCLMHYTPLQNNGIIIRKASALQRKLAHPAGFPPGSPGPCVSSQLCSTDIGASGC